MAIPFNPISITIGKDGLSSFKSLRIDQSTGAHHHFDLTVDLESGGNRQVHNISSSKEWLGKDIIVKAANKPFFCGIVTNIELHRDGSDFGCIQVSGYSSTYRMETAPSCYSWNDRSIGDVVKSLCSDGKVQLALNAAHKKQLDYICQYEESDFDFVRRLALQYQEWMYYDGLKLVFGKPRRLPDPIKMEFGTSLSSLNIGLQTLARPEQVFTFHSGANREMDRKTPDKAYGHDRMAGDAFRAALPSYPKAARQYSIQRVSSIDDLENYVLLKQAAETAETHYVTAESQDPRLHVGSVISLYSSFLKGVGNLSQESLGDFIIIEMTHEVSESCYYKNRFKAIPGTVMSLPNPKVEMPLAETQMATVLSNADPHGAGRVQVRMNWQTDNMRTSWVRVMTPDGGGSKDVKSNRGFVFIPEVGDQVLLGFRHGDPARPYVMGSLFNGTTGKGGFDSNHKKSLTTRSGSTVTFDDTAHTILLQTTRANKIFIDELNGTITISSAEEVNVNTKNININASENMNVNVGKNFTMQVGEDSSINIGKDASTSIQGNETRRVEKNSNMTINGNKNTEVYGDLNIEVTKSIRTNSMGETHLESQGVTTINAQDNLYIKSNTKVDIAKE
ncbi:type VI secretion system Vgr family protein [Prevotella jejuni]|uniref:type VI secretion system Vgr family protein n=1 Tax=Prevotella jejuni TaxID=1177574 RepID=UPI001BA511EC|nr:phage baseplate assembly protein V [Prevotella jejuni]QUB81024.1 type VI secretion system tip protein VgrG [Prevotella jejuni]